MAEDLKPDTWLVDDFSLDDRKAEPKWMVYTADDYGVTEVIALCYEKQRAEEIAALRAEVERLNGVVESTRRAAIAEAMGSEAVRTIRDLLNERHGERCTHNGKPFPCEVCDAIAVFDKSLSENQTKGKGDAS